MRCHGNFPVLTFLRGFWQRIYAPHWLCHVKVNLVEQLHLVKYTFEYWGLTSRFYFCPFLFPKNVVSILCRLLETLSVCSPVYSQREISESDHHFFSVFSCLNLDIHRVRKVTKLDFRKKILVSQQGAKSLRKDFGGCGKNIIHLYVLFYLNNGLLVFCTNQMSGKNLILEWWWFKIL